MAKRLVHRAAYVSPEEIERRRRVMAKASERMRRNIVALDVAMAVTEPGPTMSQEEFRAALDDPDRIPR